MNVIVKPCFNQFYIIMSYKENRNKDFNCVNLLLIHGYFDNKYLKMNWSLLLDF